jgi:NAD(P)-dependent dehydrogenase (short-subunit alcohol dehydrogenase family)
MITGGASWFSRETGQQLLAAGWHVALGDINLENLGEVVAALGNSDRVSSGRLDVTDLEAVKAYANKLAETHGGIDALVNVAGGSNWLQSKRIPFHETDPANWNRILGPNIYGVLNCCHAVLPHMIKARHGNIVNISSGMGLRGQRRMALYSGAKHLIIGFTQSIAQEVGEYGIRANCIAPGSAESRWYPNLKAGSETERVSPLGRRTSARDVANAIMFLLSENADHITGSCLDLSGGTSLH